MLRGWKYVLNATSLIPHPSESRDRPLIDWSLVSQQPSPLNEDVIILYLNDVVVLIRYVKVDTEFFVSTFVKSLPDATEENGQI